MPRSGAAWPGGGGSFGLVAQRPRQGPGPCAAAAALPGDPARQSHRGEPVIDRRRSGPSRFAADPCPERCHSSPGRRGLPQTVAARPTLAGPRTSPRCGPASLSRGSYDSPGAGSGRRASDRDSAGTVTGSAPTPSHWHDRAASRPVSVTGNGWGQPGTGGPARHRHTRARHGLETSSGPGGSPGLFRVLASEAAPQCRCPKPFPVQRVSSSRPDETGAAEPQAGPSRTRGSGARRRRPASRVARLGAPRRGPRLVHAASLSRALQSGPGGLEGAVGGSASR